MRIESEIKLDFKDVLIRPKRSDAPSRKSVKLIRTFKMLHTDKHFTCLPIIASNMDTVGTFKMAEALKKNLACCALHKFYSVNKLIEFCNTSEAYFTFYTLGIKDEDFEKLKNFDPNLICLDVANGYTKYFVNKVREVRKLYPNCILMAGNIATPEMTQELLLNGADIVKIGIGPGSMCKTREVTGAGYPQFSAIIECADAAHGLGGLVCADGGCKTSGDIAKAFGAGADFVMLGGMLAGCEECEGEWDYKYENEKVVPYIIETENDCGDLVKRYTNLYGKPISKKYLKVYGMSSKEAQEKYYGGVPSYAASEGKYSIVPSKGPVENIIKEITGGLRSACSYVGASNLKDFSKCCTFIKIN